METVKAAESIHITIEHVIIALTTLASVIGTLGFVVKFLYNELKKKSTESHELTISFVEATKDTAKALEANTEALKSNSRIIEKLPEQFALYMKASG